ncbi:MAG: ROK family transcriptional regulator [Verrucomicrobiota bacterium]
MSTRSSSDCVEASARFDRKIDLNNFQAATTRTARDINRRIVLNLIRKHQPISRAELARHSRLQRSTVSAITEQLIAERWVTVGALGDLPRGRKPTFLHLNSDRAAILAVDIRPTETTIAVADLSMRFLSQETMHTGENPEQFIKDLCKRISHATKSFPRLTFEGIGVALPGRVDLTTGKLTFAPNLAWKSIDLKTPLEQATGLSVALENAANACALAEIWSGRYSEQVRNLVAVTISEGIGVGMILNGQLVRGAGGLAGEFGHVTIREDGPLCNCGNKGCLDVCGSNAAAVRYYNELTPCGSGKSAPPDFNSILRMAEQGDVRAAEALDRMVGCLGAGMAMLVAGLSPDIIVLVGEVTSAWERVGPTINEIVKRRLATPLHTRILPTDPRTQPRLRGAIALVLQEHFGAPQIL